SCGRVPLLFSIGQDLAENAAFLTANLLRRAGRQVTRSCPDLTEWNNGRSVPAQAILPDRLQTVMLNPQTEVAVITAPLAEILQGGLGTDHCHVLMLAEDRGLRKPKSGDRDVLRPLIGQLMASADRCVVNVDDPSWEPQINADWPSVLMVSSNPEHPSLM